jgi:hypothetical protein
LGGPSRDLGHRGPSLSNGPFGRTRQRLCDLELSLTNERQNLRGLLKSVVVGWLLQPIRLLPKYFYHSFLFCQNFEKTFIIYAEIVIKPKIYCQGSNPGPSWTGTYC